MVIYTTSTDYKNAIKESSRVFECKLTISDKVYTNEDIVNIKVDGNIQPSDGFTIGTTTSQTLDITLLNKGDIVYSTSTIKLEIGLNIGNTIEYIPIGIYNIDDISKTDYTIKITAYDNMIKFEKAYFSTLSANPTLQQVVNELATKTGVEFTGSLPSYTVKKLEGFTCREVLGYVASICGGHAVINREGKFTIVYPKDINYKIATANYFEYKKEEVKYKIGKITCKVNDEKTISKGSLGTDSMELVFENPWMTTTILNNIYTKLNGFNYLGYSMKWQGDISLDLGDIVTITDKKGVVIKHPILSQKFNYTGGLTSEIGAKGETKNKNSFSSNGSNSSRLNRVVMEQALIKEALIEKATISDLNAANAKIENLESRNAEIENALIDKATIKDLDATNANVKNLIADNAQINKALINKANITDLTATNIKFDVGTGNTLDLQTLLAKFVSGENGQFLNITSNNVVIADAVIKDIIAKNISVEDLKAGNIDTNKINILSADGGLSIVGATMQIKDKNNKVRIQMGQDTKGDFNFILCGADGTTTLIDSTGVKEKAIADKLIKSNMVADNAIGEQQVNYSSLITGLNKDANTSLIKASKVAVDLTGQSLEVSFNKLKTNVDSKETKNLVLKSAPEKGIILGGYGTTTTKTIEKDTSTPSGMLGKITYVAEGKYGAYISNRNWNTLVVGKTYTWSIYLKADKEIEMMIGVENGGYKSVNITTQWQKYSKTFVVNSSTSKTFVLYANTNMLVNECIYFSSLKIEEGDNPNPTWTRAIEDIEEKVETNTTSITAAQGKIEGLIKDTSIVSGDVKTLKDNYTSISATVNGINTTVASHTTSIKKLNDLELGGINLLIKKDVTKGKYLIKSGDVTVNANWFYTDYIDVKGVKNIIASGFTNLGTSPSTCYYDADKKIISGINNRKEILDVPEDAVYMRFSGTIADIDNLKIEKGTKATNYSPAPEDTQNSITNVADKQATLEQSLNGFKTTVSNTYATKTALNTTTTNVNGLTTNVSALTTRVSTAESSIKQLNTQIALKVEATDITTAINTVTIGGRNLISKYVLASGYLTNEGNLISNTNWYSTGLLAVLEGKQYIASGFTSLGTSPSTCFYDSNKKFISAINNRTAILTVPARAAYLRFSFQKADLETIKLELGNKATAYTSAIEDIDKNINSKVAAINVDLNSITSRVSSTESNIKTINSKVNTVEQSITASAITTTISSAINAGTSTITTTQFVMDKSGLIIKNGALTIKNKKGHNVLEADENGNLNLNIWGSKLTVSATGDRETQMWCNYYDMFYIKVPYVNTGAGFTLKTDTNLTLIEAKAPNQYLSLPTWIRMSELSVLNNCYIAKDFSVGGSKNSLQITENYGNKLINAYETAEYYFGDIGFGKINSDGECVVYIDDIFLECVDTVCDYHVFTQIYNGKISSIEKYQNYFIVIGTKDTEFSWELKAKRLGFENNRLDTPSIEMENVEESSDTEEDLLEDLI